MNQSDRFADSFADAGMIDVRVPPPLVNKAELAFTL